MVYAPGFCADCVCVSIPEAMDNYCRETRDISNKSTTLAIDITDEHGLSNEVTVEEEQGNVVIVIHFAVKAF